MGYRQHRSAGGAAAQDRDVLSTLLDGITPLSASSGNAREDIAALFASAPMKQNSKPFLLTSTAVVSQLALLGGDSGAQFPDISIPSGGSISGIPLFGTDAAIGDSSGDLLVLLDANQIAAGPGLVLVDASRNATLAMLDDPSNAAQNLVSMFQTNSVALKAERHFGLKRLRDTAVAVLDSVQYSAGSP